MDAHKLLFLLLGVLVSTSLAVAGFTLKWQFAANAEIKVLQQRLTEQTEQVQNDLRHDRQIGKHWKLHSWAKDEINRLRVKNNLEIIAWPNLD